MKRYLNKIWLLALALATLASCQKDDITPQEPLTDPQYVLPQGEEGSADAIIYDINQKYGSYILYKDITDKDILRMWTSVWNAQYVLVDPVADQAAVKAVATLLRDSVYYRADPGFAKTHFPYKIVLAKEFKRLSGTSYSEVDTIFNGQNLLAIGKVTTAMTTMTDAQKVTLVFKMNRAVYNSFYSWLPVKPVAFNASAPASAPTVTGSPEAGHGWSTANHRMWTAGFLFGNNGGTTTTKPNAGVELCDYVMMLTTIKASEINDRLRCYPMLKMRTKLLYPFLRDELKIDVIGTQNRNCPTSKLPADFFENL